MMAPTAPGDGATPMPNAIQVFTKMHEETIQTPNRSQDESDTEERIQE